MINDVQNYQGQWKVHHGALYSTSERSTMKIIMHPSGINFLLSEEVKIVSKMWHTEVFQKDLKNEAHTQFSCGFNACSTLSSHDKL